MASLKLNNCLLCYSLDDNIRIINAIDNGRFKALIAKIFNRYTNNGSIFSEQEEIKLMEVLEINDQKKLKQVIDDLVCLVKQIIFNMSKFKSLLTQLFNLGFSEEKSIIISKVWANCASHKVDYFKDRCFNQSDCQLKDVNWKIRLQCKQSNSSNLFINKAQLDLILNQNQDKVCSLEFDHEQLSSFYNELENIQESIDSRIFQLKGN